MKVLKLAASAATAALFVVGGLQSSSAATVSVFFEDENDCSGYFNANGVGFDGCDVGFPLEANISKSIVKFKGDLSGTEDISGNYPSITGSEFSFSGDSLPAAGTWTYTPGTDDPGVRFWAAKAGGGGNSGGGFILFWTVDATSETCSGQSDANYNLACLNAAKVVTSGSWTSPKDSLSHLTFYNGVQVIPLPAAGWLLLAGVGGLVAMRRKKAV